MSNYKKILKEKKKLEKRILNMIHLMELLNEYIKKNFKKEDVVFTDKKLYEIWIKDIIKYLDYELINVVGFYNKEDSISNMIEKELDLIDYKEDQIEWSNIYYIFATEIEDINDFFIFYRDNGNDNCNRNIEYRNKETYDFYNLIAHKMEIR